MTDNEIKIEKYLRYISFYDVEWTTIYACGPLEQFESYCAEQPELISLFFNKYFNLNNKTKENMFNCLHHSRLSEQVIPFLPKVKEILLKETDAGVLDALLGLMEELNINHDLCLNFLSDFTLAPEWINEYKGSISKYTGTVKC